MERHSALQEKRRDLLSSGFYLEYLTAPVAESLQETGVEACGNASDAINTIEPMPRAYLFSLKSTETMPLRRIMRCSACRSRPQAAAALVTLP